MAGQKLPDLPKVPGTQKTLPFDSVNDRFCGLEGTRGDGGGGRAWAAPLSFLLVPLNCPQELAPGGRQTQLSIIAADVRGLDFLQVNLQLLKGF